MLVESNSDSMVLFEPCSDLFSIYIGGEGECFRRREGSVTGFFVLLVRLRWFRVFVQRLVVLDFVLLGGLVVI